MSLWLVRSWLISTRRCGTLAPSATAPIPHVLFSTANRSECTVKCLVLRGVEPSLITPPVSLVIFITLKCSLTSHDMQRRVSCSDARKLSSLCTGYEVSPCICYTIKLAASVRFNSDFVGSWRCCGLFLTVPADCSFFPHFPAETPPFGILIYVVCHLFLICGVNNIKWTFF